MMVDGKHDSRFAELKDVFGASFEGAPDDMNTEVGAAVAIYLDGKLVVDLWGGYRDDTRATAWERDTIVCVQSLSKGFLATCAWMLVDRGQLDLDKPIARYWPEFAQQGKAEIPVRWALTHQAGLPAWQRPEPGMGYDWARATRALAESKPDLTPGRDKAYHPYTFGFIVGEIVRRASGAPLRQFLRDNLTGPLSIDFDFGAHGQDSARAATFMPLRHGDNVAGSEQGAKPPYGDVMRRAIDVLDHGETYNSPAWRAAVIPAANGHTNARAAARHYAMLAQNGSLEGRKVLSSAAIDLATTLQWSGDDLILPAYVNQGVGYILNCPPYPAGPNPKAFGHAGFGGAYGFADRENSLAFGYTPNKMWLGDKLEVGARCTRLVDAAYRCLGRA